MSFDFFDAGPPLDFVQSAEIVLAEATLLIIIAEPDAASPLEKLREELLGGSSAQLSVEERVPDLDFGFGPLVMFGEPSDGDSDGDGEQDNITVTGRRIVVYEPRIGDPGPSDPGTGGGGGGGDVARETPCVEASSDAAPLSDINNAALEAAKKIEAQNDESYEYSSILYVLNGRVYSTPPFTQNLPYEVDVNIPDVPDGAVIVGIMHNHLDSPMSNDFIPSGADWNLFDAMAGKQGPRGITVDKNLLLYIHGCDDKSRVYDAADKNTVKPSCYIQN